MILAPRTHNLRPVILRFVALLAACAVAAAVLSPADAAAAKPDPVADCNANARLTHHYTAQELQNALNTMPADIKEYTDCATVIQNQLLTQLGEGHVGPGSTGSSGSFLPTPLIVVLAVLVVAAGGFGVVALRRRVRR